MTPAARASVQLAYTCPAPESAGVRGCGSGWLGMSDGHRDAAAGLWERLAGAGVEHAADRVLLGGGDRERVLALDGDLAGDVGAAERLVRRQPGGGVPVALAAVGVRVDGEQVQRVVGERDALGCGPLLRALLPGVRERDDVVDVDLRGAAAGEPDPRGGVGVGERAGLDVAGVEVGLGGQVACEDAVAGVAAAGVEPAVPELLAAVAGLRRAALDPQTASAAAAVPVGAGGVASTVCRLAFVAAWCRTAGGTPGVVSPQPATATATATNTVMSARRIPITCDSARPAGSLPAGRSSGEPDLALLGG